MPRTSAESELLDSVATKLGRSVIEWNQMCESFGILFSAVIAPQEPWSPALIAVWNSSTSDQAQRTMLISAVNALQDMKKERFPKFRDDIVWLCDKAKALSEKRNEAVHAPLTFVLNNQGQAMSVEPSIFWNHKLAKRLAKSDVAETFDKITQYAEGLKFFARRISASLQTTLSAWPDRPILPSFVNEP